MPPFKYPRASQPQGAVEIDWSNPLTKGLILAHTESGGLKNLATGAILTKVGSVSSGVAIDGRVSKFVTANGDGISVGTSAAFNPASQTLFAIVTSGAIALYQGVQLISRDSNTLGRSFNLDLVNQAGWGLRYFVNGGGSNGVNELRDGLDVVPGKRYVACATQSGANAALYVSGKLVASSGSFPAINTSTGDTQIGRRTYSGFTESLTGDVALSLMWNRALTPSEVKQLSDNPWQIFKPQSRSLWMPGTVSGGGAVNYTLSAVAGGYAVSGKAATLSYTPGAANYTLTAAAGNYAISGNSAALTYAAGSASHAYTLTAASGVYALSGKPATLTYTSLSPVNYTMAAAKGAYSVIGMDASFAFSGTQKGGGIPRKKFQIETAQGVIAVDSLAEASRIIARAKKSASKPVVTLQGIKVAAPTKKTLDYKAIEARMRAEIQAEIDDEEDLLMMS